MSKKFKVGDKVRHLSGGPMMIAAKVFGKEPSDLIECRWWVPSDSAMDARSGCFATQSFQGEELVAVEEGSKE